jgi:parallel beta-helix repeat protein
MKVSRLFPVCVAVSNLLAFTQPTFSQGILSPPGPPAPTMRTLDQIEPRTIVTNLPYTVAVSGSYYLTTNLTGSAGQAGIIILTDNVTLDLNGFALIGGGGSNGVLVAVAGTKNIAIRSGTIRDWFGDGVNTVNASNCLLDGLRTYNNVHFGLNAGTDSVVKFCASQSNFRGITTGSGCAISDCTVQNNSPGDGINVGTGCAITHCVSMSNSNVGIRVSTGGTVVGCSVQSNGGGGIAAGSAARIQDCVAASNGFAGIAADTNSVVMGCTAQGNVGEGFLIGNGCAVQNCSAGLNPTGIFVGGAGNRIEENSVSFNTSIGIWVSAASNLVVRNTARFNPTNYNITPGNTLGPTNNLFDASGNITNQNPWVNFSL